jgi:GWxTD domain-containing protein
MSKQIRTAGVAPVALPLTLIAVLCGYALAYGQPWAEYADIPNPSSGDIVFHVDVVSFHRESGRNVEEIYCIVPNDQITFVEGKGSFTGKLRFTAVILDGTGREVGRSKNVVEVSAASLDAAEDRSVVQVLQSRIEVVPGRYTAKVTLEDLNAKKKALIAILFKKYKKGEAEILIESRDFEQDRFAISDLEFARGLRRTSEGAFEKAGFEVIPNARRRYGLLLTELAVFFEVYDFDAAWSGDTLSASYAIVNRMGGKLFESENALAVRGERFGNTALFDVTSLSADSYLLVLSIRNPSGDVIARSERRFDVAWSPLSWGRYEFETIGDMEFILTDAEMRDFKSLSAGEREGYLREFWLEIDPSPGTIENEAFDEHYRRVRYADRHYGGKIRGALTDQGKIYVKYGPPDDVQSFYSDIEFVQGTRNIEGGENPVPTDPFSRVGIKTGSAGAGSWDQAGSDADAHADQIGGSTVHGKGYEIWQYDGAGEPVRRLAKRVATTPAMQFIFVDERGFGDYRLVYSTEKHEY